MSRVSSNYKPAAYQGLVLARDLLASIDDYKGSDGARVRVSLRKRLAVLESTLKNLDLNETPEEESDEDYVKP